MKKTTWILAIGFVSAIVMFISFTSLNSVKSLQQSTPTLTSATVTASPTPTPTSTNTPTPTIPAVSKQDVHDVVATELVSVKASLAIIEAKVEPQPFIQRVGENLLSEALWSFIVEGGPKNQWIELITALIGLVTIGGNLALEINKKEQPATWMVVTLRVLLYIYVAIFVLILFYLFLSDGIAKTLPAGSQPNSEEMKAISNQLSHMEKQLESLQTQFTTQPSFPPSNPANSNGKAEFIRWLNQNTTVYPIVFALVSYVALFVQRRLFGSRNRVWRNEVLKSNTEKGNDKNFTQFVVLILAVVILNYITAWPIDALFLPFLAPFFILFIYTKMQPYFSKAWFVPIRNRLRIILFIFELGAWWAFFDVVPDLIQQLIMSISNLLYVLPGVSGYPNADILDNNLLFLFGWFVQALPVVFAVLFAIVAAKYLLKEIGQNKVS